MSSFSTKSLHEILHEHDVSEAFVSDCFAVGLISSKKIFSGQDEIRLQIARKGRSLGFSLEEIRIILKKARPSVGMLVFVGGLVASFFLVEIADPASIEAVAYMAP